MLSMLLAVDQTHNVCVNVVSGGSNTMYAVNVVSGGSNTMYAVNVVSGGSNT